MNSEPIGRVMAARMDKEEDGSSYVRLQIAITDPVAAQKISDKRYMTGSVGGRAGKAICSISGDDLAAEDANGRPKLAKYVRGKIYKGKMAFADMQDISFKEYSFVNQPADQRSGVRGVKAADATATMADSWIVKSSAFVLNMDNEDIFSINENESILKSMKKKESRPLYLHLKGAFLTALAIQENENVNNERASLLSYEDSMKNKSEENLKMKDVIVIDEDILAVAGELSEDLSVIAASALKDATVDTQEEVVEVVVEEGELAPEDNALDLLKTLYHAAVSAKEEDVADMIIKKIDLLQKEQPIIVPEENSSVDEQKDSDKVTETAEERNEEVVDPAKAETLEENKDTEDAEAELTGEKVAPEQKADDSDNKLQALEEENQKLRSALHRTLVERVVDAKISVGIESYDAREELITEHNKRSASSLADSLRDLAKMPSVKNIKTKMPEINSEIEAVENEEGVTTLDGQEDKKEVIVIDLAEQIFVDALMGRRKL